MMNGAKNITNNIEGTEKVVLFLCLPENKKIESYSTLKIS